MPKKNTSSKIFYLERQQQQRAYERFINTSQQNKNRHTSALRHSMSIEMQCAAIMLTFLVCMAAVENASARPIVQHASQGLPSCKQKDVSSIFSQLLAYCSSSNSGVTFFYNGRANSVFKNSKHLLNLSWKAFNEDYFYPKAGPMTQEEIGDVKILDFWGEGRLVENDLITGFPNAYNVNVYNQPVSNGPTKGRAIPNLIPTRDYENVNISAYIADNSFQYVTLMGAPVIPAVAKQMNRIVKKNNESRILLYGEIESPGYFSLLQKSSEDNFIYMQHSHDYVASLEPMLTEVTLRPIHPFVPIKQVILDLKSHLINNNSHAVIPILYDLERYCAANYSQKQVILNEAKALLGEYGDIQSLSTDLNSQKDAIRASRVETLFLDPLKYPTIENI